LYLLDTDIISNLLRPRPSANLVARLRGVPPSDRYTSSITVGEIAFGAHLQPNRTAELIERIEPLFAGLTILPFDALAARRYGAIKADLQRRGTPIGDADVRIAAIALLHGLTVVTANRRHFARVPALRVENWL
jgi:tRNA(fMet)-specific endonuclease VapC